MIFSDTPEALKGFWDFESGVHNWPNQKERRELIDSRLSDAFGENGLRGG
jgi:hypothetical protein